MQCPECQFDYPGGVKFYGKYGNALYIPIPFIDKDNFNEAYSQVQGKPGHYSVSASVSIAESAKYFK